MSGREWKVARDRGGFALLAVLWVIAATSVLALGLSLVARQSVWAAQNRVDIARATWKADACLERARAVIGEALSGRTANSTARSAGWATLDDVVRAAPNSPGPGCDVSARPAGSAVNLAEADDELLRGVLVAARLPHRQVDSLVDALLDWRDADDVPRPHGAERAWYDEQGLHPPRNGPLADIRELSRVRGFGAVPGLDTLFSTERGRIALDHAPLVVLAALPGFTEETVQRVAERRLRGVPVGDLLSLGQELSPAARTALSARYVDLVRLTTAEPDAWILTSTAASGARGVTVTVEVRLARSGARAAIVRRRSWVR